MAFASKFCCKPHWFSSLFVYISAIPATGEWQMKLSIMTLSAIRRHAFPPSELQPFSKATLFLLFFESDRKHTWFKEQTLQQLLAQQRTWQKQGAMADNLVNNILSRRSPDVQPHPCSNMTITPTYCKCTYAVVVICREICPAVPTLIMSPSVRWALLTSLSSALALPNSNLIGAHGTCVRRMATVWDPGTTKSQSSVEKLVGWGLGDLWFFWSSA